MNIKLRNAFKRKMHAYSTEYKNLGHVFKKAKKSQHIKNAIFLFMSSLEIIKIRCKLIIIFFKWKNKKYFRIIWLYKKVIIYWKIRYKYEIIYLKQKLEWNHRLYNHLKSTYFALINKPLKANKIQQTAKLNYI